MNTGAKCRKVVGARNLDEGLTYHRLLDDHREEDRRIRRENDCALHLEDWFLV